jgi:hypothetical protein
VSNYAFKLGGLLLSALAFTACAEDGSCVRQSDCATAFVCYAGLCVEPPRAADAAVDAFVREDMGTTIPRTDANVDVDADVLEDDASANDEDAAEEDAEAPFDSGEFEEDAYLSS